MPYDNAASHVSRGQLPPPGCSASGNSLSLEGEGRGEGGKLWILALSPAGGEGAEILDGGWP